MTGTPTDERLRGMRTLTAVISDTGGVLRAKTAPAHRIEALATSGFGASATWSVFCVDGCVAETEAISPVGDNRLTADLASAVLLPGGFGWAAADLRDQDGAISAYCWRDVVRRQVTRLERIGVAARLGHELEFTLYAADGGPVSPVTGWPPYGAQQHFAHAGFAADVCAALARVGAPVEQFHAEFGAGQVELSLPPADPLTAADRVILARTVIGRVAHEHGLLTSFSPQPAPGGSGNGAHLHLSLARDKTPLFAGDGTGVPADGLAAIAGIVTELPAAIAVLAGTVVSGERLQPGSWSGAWAAWGVENREAAVRYIAGGPGTPRGANVEVKCIDGGANPWLATGLVLGLAAHGLESAVSDVAPVQVDPQTLAETERHSRGIVALPTDPQERINAFAASAVVRSILGDALHEAVLAVRRHEARHVDPDGVHERVRYAWSG
ncbi:glutamine synthetase [Naumannella cuiyingiana]|uniref:Glutamine synthetase n=1 Tax=Naumannella cuiyingiana TaxID=1347891 RepID=A0A7Z0IKY3_9ACTN|nr:glutamine synthetase family protein [Naumannella cuiyingiana]NYI70942.1 glutamine synthetase [Naumannella cuiyingiana]